MGFSFNGHVLRSAQVATGNSATTATPDTGVVRDLRPVPAAYTMSGDAPGFVDAAADQYRAGIVESPGTTTNEYVVWAANTGSLAGPKDSDPSWWTESGTGVIPTGTLGVGAFSDGSEKVFVVDTGNRTIGRVYAVVVARGDVADYDDEGWKNIEDVNPASYPGLQPRLGDNPYLTLYFEEADQNSYTGVCYLTAAHKALLGGGLSSDRGDSVVAVHYTVGSARFWWSRNDRYAVRFGWNGQQRRWEPFKGSSPSNLGRVELGTIYQMAPAVRNLPVGASLPGNSDIPDSYAMVRVGVNPGALDSIPVGAIRVISDAEVLAGFDFSTEPSLNGVVGQSNGKLEFNPSFIELNAGKTIWYIGNSFHASANGIIGKVREGNLFLAPLPGPTDFPLLRLGSRAYLTPVVTSTDAEMDLLPPPEEGTCYVSSATGKVRISHHDREKANPDSSFFSKHFLDEDVIYDGVSLSGAPQPTRAPVQLLDGNGNPALATSDALYIPAFQYLPTEFASVDSRRGLGKSGILDAPDGTGSLPAGGNTGSVRPGGDNTIDATTGRVRVVQDGVSDTLLFTQLGVIAEVESVPYEQDLPDAYSIPEGTAYVACESGLHGSKVVLNPTDAARLGSKAIYFLQAGFNPAVHETQPRILSRNRDVFRFDGSERLFYAIDGVSYTWLSNALVNANPAVSFFTPEQVAESLNLVSPNVASVLGGHIVLASSNATGTVEIGFGTGGEKDLSGASCLGFLPGWRVKGGVDNWLPDAGITLGMYRSPFNLNGNTGVPDFRDADRVEDFVLTDSIPKLPFQFLTAVPLQDRVGVDEGVFFSLDTTVTDGDSARVLRKPLEHYTDVIHRFGQRKFDWVAEGFVTNRVETAATTLHLGASSIAPESLDPVLGGGLYVSPDGRSFQQYRRGLDYLMPQDGIPGNAVLVHQYLGIRASGANGRVEAGNSLFEDTRADFSVAAAGDILVVEGSAYTVVSVANSTTLQISPTPTVTISRPALWELRENFPDTVYNPAIVYDMGYQDFNHLPQESMEIRVLTRVLDGKANLSGAVRSGREISLRFGLVAGTPENVASLTPLLQTDLGLLSNSGLVLPDTETVRFATAAFSVKVGTQRYTQGQTLLGVLAFSSDPEGIEYLTADLLVAGEIVPKGSLKFGTGVLSGNASSTVFYLEDFLAPSDLGAGQAEYNPFSGEVQISAADALAHAGKPVYLVERLITEQRKDVSINPMLGAFSTNVPLPAGSSVECSYWAANLEGRKVGNRITEFLPVFIRDEVCQRVAENVYRFNAPLHDVVRSVEPIVYIGPILQNFGQLDFMVDYPVEWGGYGRLTFVSQAVPDGAVVKVSYGVYDLLGGERSFEVSHKPVYRPPFFIKAGQDRFGVRGNRVSEFEPGQMLRIGEECLYVKSVRYYESDDVTAVYIFPPTTNEVGSRAPGNDVVTVITTKPVTTVVDPDGGTPVATAAPAGFMSAIDLEVFPFEPVGKGQMEVVFRGNLKEMAVPGHLLEMGGSPHTIAGSSLSEDGSRTTITVTAPFWRNFSAGDNPTVKLSYRPIYPPAAKDFLGTGAFLDSEGSRLFRFPQGLPGYEMVRDVDYTAEPNSGAITLKHGAQVGDVLLHAFTRLNMLEPYMQDGIPVIPKYQASYLALETPSEDNGILGGTLTGTYSYAQPDSFYFRAVRLPTFMGEVTEEVVQEIRSKQPTSGAVLFSNTSAKNWEQGRFGLRGERRHLLDKDRVARTFLDFYNSIVGSFEQIEETLSGGFIGDRDGKFRFWVGRGRDLPAPGYEDTITGYLSPHNVWDAVVSSENPSAKYYGLQSDALVSPDTLTVVNGEVTGTLLDSMGLSRLIDKQRELVKNDVDDTVLTGVGATQLSAISTSPYYALKAEGGFRGMWEEHRLSRLYPTVTEAFLRTLPGVGYDSATGYAGVYTAGRTVGGAFVSTNGSEIAQLQNPVIGGIYNVQGTKLHPRRARARVWRYCPDGIPAGALGTNVPLGAITDPCIIAVNVLLRDVPVRAETGFPDSVKLADVPNLRVGDPEKAVPGFAAGDQITCGKPDGSVYTVSNLADPKTIYGEVTYGGVYVREVLYDCVFTLQDASGNAITISAAVSAGDHVSMEPGDTIFVGPPQGTFAASLPDPPEFSTFQTLTAGLDGYREGFDIKVTPAGKLIDISLPSSEDGSLLALKEIFGQNAPKPLAALEGTVEFVRGSSTPLGVPALSGGIEDDSGDRQIPYISTNNSEMSRVDSISSGLSEVLSTVDPLGHAVYPEEVVDVEGEISAASALVTTQDLTPGFGFGKGDVRPYDLMLVGTEGDPFGIQGPLGIQTVGAVSTTQVETPRFVTATKAPSAGSSNTGDPICYTLANAMVFVQGPYPAEPQIVAPPLPGVFIVEDVLGGETILDFGTTTITLNDGQTVGVGNLNEILAASPSNKITLRLIARRDVTIVNGPPGANPLPSLGFGGLEALRIEFQGLNVTVTDFQGGVLAGLALPVFGTKVLADPSIPANRQIRIPATGLIPWGPGPGTTDQWFLPHTVGAGPVYETVYGFEFSFSLETLNPGMSRSAWIAEDRLTFHEVCDLSFAKKRGYTHPQSGISLETGLAIHEITVGNTAGTTIRSSVNKYVNGMNGANPIPLTFVPRVDPETVGSWQVRVGAVTERGSLKVMAFEGHTANTGNVAVTATEVHFSAVPSNERDATGLILSGTGKAASRFNLGLISTARWDNRIVEVAPAAGSLAKVLPGDICVVSESANPQHPGTHQAGTYLVRHAVEATPGKEYLRTSPVTVAGAEAGWCPLHFPTVVSFAAGTLVISDLAPAPGGVVVGGQQTGFSAPGADTRIYIIRDVSGLASSDLTTFRYSVISARYTAIALGAGDTGIFTLVDYKDATNVAMAEVDFQTKATGGFKVSGMTFWPVKVSGASYGLPENNCVGFDSDSTFAVPPAPPTVEWAVYGFHLLQLVPPKPLLDAAVPAVAQTFTGDDPGAPGQFIRKVVSDHAIVPILGAVGSPQTFQADTNAPVYDWVAVSLNVTGLKNSDWNPLNVPGGAASLVDCVLPGTLLRLGNGVDEGFYAQAGVFLEPSIPRSSLSLVGNHAKVVDLSHSLPDPALVGDDWERELGMRDSADYRLSGAAVNVPDEASFEIRRIRRFHGALEQSDQNLQYLRYAYEIRRGRVTGYSQDNKQGGIVVASAFVMDWETTKPGGSPKAADVWNEGGTYTGTNLGGFTDRDVNIHTGDIFRLLGDEGTVLEEIPIVGVQDDSTLLLAAPGIQNAGPLVGMRFEVFLRRAPVPQEQSCEELLALLTDREVTRTDADWDTQKGGYVPDMTTGSAYAEVVNKLYDDLNVQTFSARGVQKGDIVVVDPLGTVPKQGGLPVVPEKGLYPVGDMGVSARVVAGVYVPGAPSPLDDNRGYYRVRKVVDTGNAPYLLVDPISTFAGTGESPVVFGIAANAYAVYPTVHDSALKKAPYPVQNPAVEGQMDLRPTRLRDAVTQSFQDRGDAFGGHSIRPFSYRVIRPSQLFSREAVDLVLMTRERVLSLIELLQVAVRVVKSGSYFVFQRDEHLEKLGSPFDSDEGVGVPSNGYIANVGGRMEVVPYANGSKCLSVLDRRFWGHDRRLDSLTTNGFGGMRGTNPGDTPYTSTTGVQVLPVLPERIETILQSSDKFREIRDIWLSYRADKLLGTLAAIERLEEDLPKRIEEQQKLVALEVATRNT